MDASIHFNVPTPKKECSFLNLCHGEFFVFADKPEELCLVTDDTLYFNFDEGVHVSAEYENEMENIVYRAEVDITVKKFIFENEGGR